MPDYDNGYRAPAAKPTSALDNPVAGYVGEGGHSIDWQRFDRKVDVMTKDELRYALKKEARLRADTEARRNEVI